MDGSYPSFMATDPSLPLIRRGWRAFRCEECFHAWEYPTRDRLSPSGEDCPECHTWCTPRGNREDATLPCDDSGNLLIAWNAEPGKV